MTEKIQDAQAKLGTRADDGFRRTAIILQHNEGGGGTVSIDVLAPNGEPVCQLNIASHHGKAQSLNKVEWCNVDVCYGRTGRKGKALAWREGREVLGYEAEGSSLIAVELTKEG